MGEQNSSVFSRPALTLDEELLKKFSEKPDEMRRFIMRLIDSGDLPKAYAETGMAPIGFASGKSMTEAMEARGITSEYLAEKLDQIINGKVTKFDRNGEPYSYVDKYLSLKGVELALKSRGELVNIHKRDNSDKKGVMDLFPETDESG